MTRLITYRATPVAIVVHGDLAVFVPEVDALQPHDPIRRFVVAQCRLAMEIELGLASGAYDQQLAEAYARGY